MSGATSPPAASAIVCVYNRSRQAAECLESLRATELGSFEIVAVDDASTDDSAEVLEAWRAAHPEVAMTVVRNERNLGVSGARNAGVRAARGEIVAFTDSDCVVEPGWLGALVAAFEDAGIGAVSGEVEDVPARTYAERAYRGTCRVGAGKLQARGLIGCNMAFRRELLEQYPFDDALEYGCDEDDVAWRLASEGWRIAFAAGARVRHDHPMRLGEYLRQGFRQGQGSARFWFKSGRVLGRDLVLLALAVGSLPLGLVDRRLLWIGVVLLTLHLAALLFAEISFKGKGPLEALLVLPGAFLHSVWKLVSVAVTRARIAVGLEPRIRASKEAWRRLRSESRPGD